MPCSKPKPPPSLKPHKCVVLAVDTAKQSGWSIFVSGRLHSSGAFNVLASDGHVSACQMAEAAAYLAYAKGGSGALALVLEKPWGGGTHTTVGLGKAHGVWESAWMSTGEAKRRIVLVYPQTWRAAVLGFTQGKDRLASEEGFTAIGLGAGVDVGPDEAAAVCIGKWASHAGEVAAVMPKPRKVVG